MENGAQKSRQQIEAEIIEENMKRGVVDANPDFLSIRKGVHGAHESENQGSIPETELKLFIGRFQLDRMRSLANNRAFRKLRSSRRAIGPLIIFCKRVVRKLLKWYLEPVCDQQTDFNYAAVRTLDSAVWELERLTRQCAEMETQIKEMQTRIAVLEQGRQTTDSSGDPLLCDGDREKS